MSEKICFKCGNLKPLSEFYCHPRMADGHLGKCKECTKRDVSVNYADKRAQYSRYDQLRQDRPARKLAAMATQKRRRQLNPAKYRAWTAVSNAIRDGRLTRQPCECGSPISQAHHADYNKLLDVVWVCFRCHREKKHGQVVTVLQG